MSFQLPEEIPGVSVTNFLKYAKNKVTGKPVKIFQFKDELSKYMEELNMNPKNISKTVDKICNNIVKSFYEDFINLYFLNVKKGNYKKCCKCGEIKLTNRFDKKGKQGLQSRCKKCRKEK